MPAAFAWRLLLVASLLCLLAPSRLDAELRKSAVARGYAAEVLADRPIAYWRFSGSARRAAARSVTGQFKVRLEGQIGLNQEGPRPETYPLFRHENTAATFFGDSWLRVKESGRHRSLAFGLGDAITLEAWVKPTSIGNGKHQYVIGKGRTNNRGYARENQNYALRLTGEGGTAKVSFLFRNAANRTTNDYHRWTSNTGLLPDEHWHYIAVSYQFGKPESIRGYIDGKPVPGTWDMGGPTAKAPVVDDDELWIGSSLGGNPRSTFLGALDEIAIYRQALPPDRIRLRYRADLPDTHPPELADDDLPLDTVVVEIYEGIPSAANWNFQRPRVRDRYTQPTFALIGVPKRYEKGLIADRSNPLMVSASSRRDLPAGEYEFLLRSKNAARLFIDGELVAETDFMRRNGSGHEAVPELAESRREGLYALLPEHKQELASVPLAAGEHLIQLEAIVGGKSMRAEIGEVCVCVRRQDASHENPFELLTANGVQRVWVNDADWLAHVEDLRRHLSDIQARSRQVSALDDQPYWDRRHALARRYVAELPPIQPPSISSALPLSNQIDRFIGRRLERAGLKPLGRADDDSFLRRLCLDTVGVIPSLAEINQFARDRRPGRRSRAIDRLLEDPRWADNWVGYWQDVLAENPGILKPKLNNTGPFRWWIYESFRDNKSIDRFVTELVMMQGSLYGGGPAGFSLATQNDVPMAAKAQILSHAFLGLEMKCARCHDAPYHPHTQESLFSLAAMLHRRTISLPLSSTVPVAPGAREPAVERSLAPGAKIDPHWPLADLISGQLPAEILRNPADPRERLAARLTWPANRRFAQVIVNRMWQRYFGRGLVQPVDDWQAAQPSHPQLLEWLSRQLVAHDYDLKHVARLIFNSHAYQRKVQPDERPRGELLAGQTRRRLSAEQVVDSLFVACGKPLRSEVLTLDPEGRRSISTFLNLGRPRRAWQFTSLSNERDRPALALPMAQSFVDVLLAYGWRDARPHPISVRDESPTMLQPLTLANGVVGHRATTLSDDSYITQLCLEDQTLEQLIDRVFQQVLSRRPQDGERQAVAQLGAGFEQRRTESAVTLPAGRRRRSAVSWSNHLSAEATKIKLEMERAVRAGDPPTSRLQPDWRQRMEDVVWALINSPEFVFVP